MQDAGHWRPLPPIAIPRPRSSNPCSRTTSRRPPCASINATSRSFMSELFSPIDELAARAQIDGRIPETSEPAHDDSLPPPKADETAVTRIRAELPAVDASSGERENPYVDPGTGAARRRPFLLAGLAVAIACVAALVKVSDGVAA